jgi:hypothetical protein
MKENPYNSTKPHNLFVGRQELLDELINGFRNGNSFAVLGGRRCGKTSLLLELERRLQKRETLRPFTSIPRYLDMQALGQISSEELFEQIYSLVVQDVAAPKWNPSSPGKEYQNFLDHLDRAAELLKSTYRPRWLVLLLIDELDSAIGRLPNDMFFQNIRNLLMVSRFNIHFRLVATGVKNLTGLISSGSSPLNNLTPKALGIMSYSEAQQLVRHGLSGEIPPAIESQVFRLTGMHPYLLQALFERIDLENALDITVLERAVRKFLKETRTFQKWFDGFGNAERMVYNALSSAPEGRLSIERLRSLLDFRVRLELDDALATLSFHCVIDDTASDESQIAGTMFRDWFSDHSPNNVTQGESKPIRNTIFVSYSHKDRKWLEKLRVMLKPVSSDFIIWDDSKIPTGTKWREEIRSALESAKVSVMLVSPDFLASDFIQGDELPVLLKAAENDGLKVCWLLISTCLYRTSALADFQAAHDTSRPLAGLRGDALNRTLTEICEKISTLFRAC